MEDKPTNGELAIMIQNLTNNVQSGFKGVHQRQDAANHEIDKSRTFREENAEFLKTLKRERDDTFRRYTDMAWKLATAAIGIALGFRSLLH